MFFLFKSIGVIIWFIIKSLFYIGLLIYKISILTLKGIKFLFINKFLRVPTTLLIVGALFSLNFSIISTIYFLYLTHSFAVYKGIYNIIYTNIKKLFNELKYNSDIKNMLKTIPNSNVILSNVSLENDEKILNIYHLAITPSGLYNIIPLSSFLDNKTSKKVINNIIYDIYNETENIKNLLTDIIDEDIPLTTVILSEENYIENNITIDNIKLINQNQLPFLINSNKKINNFLDIYNLKELLLENKAWFLDRLWLKFTYFIKNNKKLLSFFIMYPIIYYIYILIINILYNSIIIIFKNFIEFISNLI